jgi:hypothetical protein
VVGGQHTGGTEKVVLVVVEVGAARCVVVVLGDEVVEVVAVVVVVVAVVLVVAGAIAVEALAALDDGWLVHAAAVNATAVAAHTTWAKRRRRGVISPISIGLGFALQPPPPSIQREGILRRIRSSMGAVKGR